MYEFSVPMPFDMGQLDMLAAINKEVDKSKITCVYNALPINAVDLCGYEQARVRNSKINSFEDMLPLIEHAKELGFHFVYLINSPDTFDGEEFEQNKEKLNSLCEKLLKYGVGDVRVASTYLIEYLQKHYPEIKVRCSTSMEYTSLKQYNNLLKMYDNIIEVVPSWEETRNFRLLENFHKLHPEIIVEMMVNEGCLAGCPFRMYHSLMKGHKYENETFFKRQCDKEIYENLGRTVFMSNIILPWHISAYEKYGINHFKLVGRNAPPEFLKGAYGDVYRDYLLAVDDVKNVWEKPFFEFNHYVLTNPHYKEVKVKDVYDYLPDISYFENKKTNCHDECGAGCTYCEVQSQKLNEILKAKRI